MQFTQRDVVRHGLVRRIVEAYERHEPRRGPVPTAAPAGDEPEGSRHSGDDEDRARSRGDDGNDGDDGDDAE